MNVGELVGGAVVVFVVGSQIAGMFRSVKKTSAGVASASALIREALAERAATGEAPDMREVFAATRGARVSAPPAFEAPRTEALAGVVETALHIARQARENSAHAAGKQRGQQPRAHLEDPTAYGVRLPLKALEPAAPARKLHPMAAQTPLLPKSPLSPHR